MSVWDDTAVVEELKARACVLCGGLVTPPHRYCGWHDFWWRVKNRELLVAAGGDFLRFAVMRDKIRRMQRFVL